MEKVFYKNSEGRLDDDFIDVVDSTETLEDGSVIEHTHREKNPSPNTYGKYAKAVKHWTAQGLTVYDRGDYYEFAEPEPVPVIEPTEQEKAQADIERLEAELKEYDYIGTKIAMGVATREEYAKEIEYTESLRRQIRKLEPIALKE